MSSPSSSFSSSTSLQMDVLELDAVELEQFQKTIARRQSCAKHSSKLFISGYILFATVATMLCLTSFRPLIENASSPAPVLGFALRGNEALQKEKIAFPDGDSDLSVDTSDEFQEQAACLYVSCLANGVSWCCPDGYSCDYDTARDGTGYCISNAGATLALAIILVIIIGIWFGPLIVYLIIIGIVRCSQAGRFQGLANSGRFQSWVIISGCFQMSVKQSSGDADFTQTAHSLVNAYGGCGDECIMHCIGVWCCSTCYPCCMCCVSAARNQSKVSTLQNALARRGFSTDVEFMSSIVPACCNSIFIGVIGKIQPAVMVVASSNVAAYPQGVQYAAPGSPVMYGQPGVQMVQPPYGQPQLAQPAYAVAAPSYAPATTSSQPPEVLKPSA